MPFIRRPEADEIAFITAATWPDFIKGAEGYTNDGDHPTSRDAADNIGYSDKLQHRYWHYYDTPFSADQTVTQPADSVNALTQIRMFTRALSKSTDHSVLSYDVVWLEHMVGDVHRPLHATSRFDEEDPQGDAGVNRVKICSSPTSKSCKTALHAYWDDLPGSGSSPIAARSRAKTLAASDPSKVSDMEPADWIRDSFELAKKVSYAAPIEVGDGPFRLDAAYSSNAKQTADQQVALAGARLAALLNSALGAQ